MHHEEQRRGEAGEDQHQHGDHHVARMPAGYAFRPRAWSVRAVRQPLAPPASRSATGRPSRAGAEARAPRAAVDACRCEAAFDAAATRCCSTTRLLSRQARLPGGAAVRVWQTHGMCWSTAAGLRGGPTRDAAAGNRARPRREIVLKGVRLERFAARLEPPADTQTLHGHGLAERDDQASSPPGPGLALEPYVVEQHSRGSTTACVRDWPRAGTRRRECTRATRCSGIRSRRFAYPAFCC